MVHTLPAVVYATASYAMTPSTHLIYGSADVTAPYHIDNNGGPSQLAWPNDLAGAIAFLRRITREPEVDPLQDTLSLIIDTTKDRPGLDGVGWFTLGHEKMAPPHEFEAMCRVLFQAIITRCERGYRGLPRAERLSKNRHTRRRGTIPSWKVDLNCDCKTRIENAISSMREWKSICKVILVSDSQIEKFANAPLSTATDKKTYQGNNGTKDANSQNERAASVAAAYGPEAVDKLKAKGKLPTLSRPRKEMSEQDEVENKNPNISSASEQTTRHS
ncbi:hypothetical protein E8E12_002221 [Didymella heteroderae]|uniref:Uncharacterized protein n=1 Tax=Didymella heteroderae TaxID=1769908 RepID=A0A9P5BX48_9PLEO|nr:hypothetical protein E8E12_002221 [Didymella heteroderae]